MEHISHQKEAPLDASLLRHMILNTLRSNVSKYKTRYAPIVLACDSRKYWRKDVFPYYKANRKKTRDESPIDWEAVFNFFTLVKGELAEYSPYRVIEVEGAEGDDVIGTLVWATTPDEPVLILSGDHDFIQLQVMKNVKQYDPIRKREVASDNPMLFVRNHIIEGDRGDGVPNVLSDDDTFVIPNKRQITLTKKRRALLMENAEFNDEVVFADRPRLERNFKRNALMIDLSYTPEDIKKEVLNQYNKQANKKNRLHEYFIKNQMRNLFTSIGDY